MRAWLPVVTLMISVFAFNTSEFLPIGLLSDMARDLSMTEAEAGRVITGYAWIVSLMSLPLMLLVARVECRRLMLAVVGLFILSNAASSFASGFWSLMAARAGVACAHAVFWSIVTPLAVLAAPARHQRAALSLIVVASSVAMILGLPLGRALGLLVGWRLTFAAIGAVAAVSFVMLLTVFPSIPSRNAVSLKELPSLLARPEIWGLYVITAVTITGHFTAYTFIEPFLSQVAHFAQNSITVILSLFGLVGIAASVLYANFFGKCPKAFIVAALAGTALLPMLLAPAAESPALLTSACILWGLAIGFFNLVFQASIIRFAPNGTAVVMSIYSGIYNVGIGGGALVGGLVCTHAHLSQIGLWGGAIAALSALFGIVWYLRQYDRAERAAAARTASASEA